MIHPIIKPAALAKCVKVHQTVGNTSLGLRTEKCTVESPLLRGKSWYISQGGELREKSPGRTYWGNWGIRGWLEGQEKQRKALLWNHRKSIKEEEEVSTLQCRNKLKEKTAGFRN